MLSVFHNELRRGVRSWRLPLGLLICLLTYYLSFANWEWRALILYHSGTWTYNHFMFTLEFNPYRAILPLAATVPYAAAVAKEWEHRGHFLAVRRTSFLAYGSAKFFAAATLGGLVLTVGLWIYLGFMACFIPPTEPNAYLDTFAASMIQNEQWVLYFLCFGSLQFLLGALCAGLGCLTATLTARRGMIYLVPLLLLAMIEIMSYFTLVGLSSGQSSLVLRQADQSPLHIWLLIASVFAIFLAMTYIAFQYLLRKRVFIWQ